LDAACVKAEAATLFWAGVLDELERIFEALLATEGDVVSDLLAIAIEVLSAGGSRRPIGRSAAPTLVS
jgi:hypothetical protein